jgi:hypothetical protein
MANYAQQYGENKHMYIQLKEQPETNNLDWEKYIKTQLTHISKNRGEFGDPLWDTIRSIPSGGAFTSTVNIDGYVLDTTEERIQSLWERIGHFVQLAEKFRDLKQPDYVGTVTVYRSLEIHDFTEIELQSGNSCTNIYQFFEQNNSTMPHPIPFSCSWNGDLATEQWQNVNCCLLEIDMPNNYPFVTTSLPEIEGKDIKEEVSQLRKRRIFPLNQDQFEVVLAPGFVIPYDCRLEEFGEKYVFILKCSIKQMSYEQIRSYFPADKQQNLFY